MGGYRKELFKSALVAVMSAALLGALTYHLIQPEDAALPVVFGLGEAGQFSGNYSTLEGYCLILQFTFLNRSRIEKNPLPSHEEMCQGLVAHDEYSGELEGTKLQRITLSIYGVSSASYNTDAVVRYLAACLRDRIINVTLVDRNHDMTDLGSSKHLGSISSMQTGDFGDPNKAYYNSLLDELMASFNATRRQFTSTGFWVATDYVWSITIDELGDMLQGSGTATIAFTLDINMKLKYVIVRTSEEDLTGNATLSWTGTWGTLQLTYEEGRISLVKYSFATIKLIMTLTD